MKPIGGIYNAVFIRQPPSGGCVLKLHDTEAKGLILGQPPSGGCVLKLHSCTYCFLSYRPAAFGRLCVETPCLVCPSCACTTQPPSGGCVLKPIGGIYNAVFIRQPPSGGCVLKQICPICRRGRLFSRLRAAVC